jgi:hypothetical protein
MLHADVITSYLLFILRHPAVPARIPVQAARTLDKIVEFVPRDLMAASSELQATVQRRVLDVLAQQMILGGFASSASMELLQ